jgi:transcriptional regulator with XRE-family HTH domain
MGWTQTELAEAAGLSQNAISNYERGEREAGSAALVALANALRCSVDYLLELSDEQTAQRGLSAHEAAVVAALRAGERLEAIRLIVGEG